MCSFRSTPFLAVSSSGELLGGIICTYHLYLPYNGTLLLLLAQTSSWVPLAVAFHSLPLTHCSLTPLGYLCTANPNPLP